VRARERARAGARSSSEKRRGRKEGKKREITKRGLKPARGRGFTRRHSSEYKKKKKRSARSII